MANTDALALEILDSEWTRLYLSNQVQKATITDELGAVGDGEITIPLSDPALAYIPDATGAQSNEGRWRLWEGAAIKFAGVVDQTTRTVNEDDTYTFGGKQRGILLGTSNLGRRDFNGWPVDDVFQELLRDNIGRAPFANIQAASSQDSLHPGINAITGDPFKTQYWAAVGSGSSYITIDLGAQSPITGIRVIPPWWDTRWYKFTAATSPDNSTYTTRGTKTDTLPLSDRGELFEFTATARYVKVTVDDSTDDIGRLASVMAYRDIGTIGTATTFNLAWIENDDSGNVTLSGSSVRTIENGAFNGDGVLGNSLVTRLPASSGMTHRFRGTSNSVYFTQGTSGGTATANIYLDDVFVQNVTINGSTYQINGYEVTGLTNGVHTLRVDQASGTPQVDYFTGEYASAYRIIRDADPSIGYVGTWRDDIEGASYRNFTLHRSNVSASTMVYDFTGDKVLIIGTNGPAMGKVDIYIDGGLVSTVDLYAAATAYQQTIFTWSGSYAAHEVRAVVRSDKNASSTGYDVDIDGLEGNFAHIIYIRSFYEPNLRVLTRLSEITNSYLRFNNDGSVDLLGSVGDTSNTIIREGENEGGTIINAEAVNDYSETASAVLALVTGPEDLPIKAFVVDRTAVERMGLKVRKMEQADARDAYLLTRQAWQELQDHKNPQSRYNVQYDPENVGDVEVGQTTILYSDRLNLDGSQNYRVGRLITEYTED